MVVDAAGRALERAEEIARAAAAAMDEDDPDGFAREARLRKAYRDALLADPDFALERKVERDLWNFGFKERIERLQNATGDKKNSRRAESRTPLAWTLRSATGFYADLLRGLCDAFDLALPFGCDAPRAERDRDRDRESPPGKIPRASTRAYLIQYCLVHLGDLARYGGQSRRAESFYRLAADVSPDNGQPYNQLGLLRAARGDRLGAAYYHARGSAVGGPFLPAVDNLSRTLASAASRIGRPIVAEPVRRASNGTTEPSDVDGARPNRERYANEHLALHHRLRSGETADVDDAASELNSALVALVATDEFDRRDLIRMCCLDLYAIHAIDDDRSDARDHLANLIAGTLTSLLLPAHTRASSELIDYSALPAVKILFEWIRLRPHVLKERAFVSRPQLWPALCALLNNLQSVVEDLDGDEHRTAPLPEDVELRGFLPIDGAFSELKFDKKTLSKRSADESVNLARSTSPPPPERINDRMNRILETNHSQTKRNSPSSRESGDEFFDKLRIFRLIKIGEWLCAHVRENDMDYLTFSIDDEDKRRKIFTPIQNSLENTQVLKTIRELSLLREKRLHETSHRKLPRKEDDEVSDVEINKFENVYKDNIRDEGSVDEHVFPIVISEADFKDKVCEKRAGILKPQGSLEKARNEKSRICRMDLTQPEFLKISNDTTVSEPSDIQDTGSGSSTVSQDGPICSDIGLLLDPPLLIINDKSVNKKEGKKMRTNVAMQTIMRKQEETNKQVKFLTPATTPDSVNEPTEMKNSSERKKIIQPKVLKSLNSLPTDRKTGGILSLKDKSAGYPHLVNNAVSSLNVDNEKVEGEDGESSDRAKDADNAENQPKPKTIFSQKFSQKPFDAPVSKQIPYATWSDGLSAPKNDNIFNDNLPNFNFDHNNSGGYSYFPNFSNQKLQNPSIPLPVVNPKEIDVRSASMQRQRNSHMPPLMTKYPQYSDETERFNPWNMSNDKNFKYCSNSNVQNENAFQINAYADNFAGSYNHRTADGNFPNMPINNVLYNNGRSSVGKNWWSGADPKPASDTNYQQISSNLSPNPRQMMPNVGNFNNYPHYNYPQTNQPSVGKSPNFNHLYQQSNNFNPALFQNVPNTISSGYLLHPQNMYGNINLGTQPKQFAKENTDNLHVFNADIPEFIPKAKDMLVNEDNTDISKPPIQQPGNSSTYSLFSGPDSPWQTKKIQPSANNQPWPGSAQSPLEKLLEQQKQFKYPSNDT